MTRWDNKFVALSKHIAQWSKDTNSKNGAIIVDNDNVVVSMGYNDLPMGIDDTILSRYERPEKYLFTEHAERNAIYLARNGGKVKGSKMYVTLFPCADCARAICQSGITMLITPKPDLEHERWGAHFKASLAMLTEKKVIIKYIE